MAELRRSWVMRSALVVALVVAVTGFEIVAAGLAPVVWPASPGRPGEAAGWGPVVPGWRLPGGSVGILPFPNVMAMAPAAATRSFDGPTFGVVAPFAFTVFTEKDVTVQHGGSNDYVNVYMRMPVHSGYGAIYARYSAQSGAPAISLSATQSNTVRVMGRLETPRGPNACGSSGNSPCIQVDTPVNCSGCQQVTNGRDIPFPVWDFAGYKTMAQARGTYPICDQNGSGCYFGGSTAASDFTGYVNSKGGTISGLFFIETDQLSLTANTLAVNGTIVVYKLDGSTVKGRIKIKTGTYTHTATGGEPAILAGGSICTDSAGVGGAVTITGILGAQAGDPNENGGGCGSRGIKFDSSQYPYSITGAVISKESILLLTTGTVQYDPKLFRTLPSKATFPAGTPIVTWKGVTVGASR